MKLNYDVMKEILEHVEKFSNGTTTFGFSHDEFHELAPNFKPEEILYHAGQLFDAGLISGRIGASGDIEIKDLTMAGHQSLEAMRSNTIWNKIKDKAITMGVEGLKQIPALAIKIFMS